MHHARFKAFTLVGLAYLILAVVLPLILIYGFNIYGERDQEWTTGGVAWGLAAGAAGALGALGIIIAFGEGGNPGIVMPIVFGCAPVVNAIVYTTMRNKWAAIRWEFVLGMVLVAVGAVMVLYFTPPPDKKPAKTDEAAPAEGKEKVH